MSKDPFNPDDISLSPLGNNQVEGTGSGQTPISQAGQRDVPVVYDSITGTYSAKLSKINQEDRLLDLEKARISQEDQEFISKAGFRQV